MTAIHLIKNDPSLQQITPIALGSDIFHSGYWVIAEDTAKALVGGNVFFHKKQEESSFFGGVIESIEVVRGSMLVASYSFSSQIIPAKILKRHAKAGPKK